MAETSCRACATRRSVLIAAGAATATVALAGCQVYGGSAAPPPPAPADPANPPAPAATGGDGPADPAGPDRPQAPALARLADIPVGGGKIFEDKNIVVTQPEPGTVKAFSATCTHQGCSVTEVAGGTINCRCHNSRFRVADGSVQSGPAGSPLAPVGVIVQGDAIRLT